MVLLRGDRCEAVHELTPLVPFGVCGKDTMRFIDFLEGRDFRIETKVVARKEREKENPSKAHLPLEE